MLGDTAYDSANLREELDEHGTKPVIPNRFGLIVAPSNAWYTAMVGSLLIVLAVEFLNTAIEKFADHVTRRQHKDIRRIKDFGSAAVFCSLCLAGLVWLVALVVRSTVGR
jgi:diacylglycerol kinase